MHTYLFTVYHRKKELYMIIVILTENLMGAKKFRAWQRHLLHFFYVGKWVRPRTLQSPCAFFWTLYILNILIHEQFWYKPHSSTWYFFELLRNRIFFWFVYIYFLEFCSHFTPLIKDKSKVYKYAFTKMGIHQDLIYCIQSVN